MIEWEAFHFLRPAWLLALLPAAGLLWLLASEETGERAWKDLIAPHLLGRLTVGSEETRLRIRPLHLLAAFWALGALALAGPAWQREAAPFAEDQAALVIALEVTPTMRAQDVQPSRLERAVQKIRDLLELRRGARTALVAYSGSAHLVIPLTRDAQIIETFAAELSPEIMPAGGDVPDAAVRLANAQLTSAGLPGSILLVTDEIPVDQWEDLRSQRAQGGAEVHVYAVAAGLEIVPPPGSPPAPALDRSAMADAARAAGGGLTVLTVDDSDVEELAGRIRRSVSRVAAEQGERWRDGGYALVPLLSLIVLFWFRRGWKVGKS